MCTSPHFTSFHLTALHRTLYTVQLISTSKLSCGLVVSLIRITRYAQLPYHLVKTLAIAAQPLARQVSGLVGKTDALTYGVGVLILLALHLCIVFLGSASLNRNKPFRRQLDYMLLCYSAYASVAML